MTGSDDEFANTTISELTTLLTTTNIKSCILDPIPASMFKCHSEALLPIITRMVNLSLSNATVPEKFKEAVLFPKVKSASVDHELFSNFRPISNLRFISKVTEKVVASRLNCHVDNCNLSELYQSAYKKGHSTETALIRVNNDILRAIDNRGCVILLLMDLSAAFDTVDHCILLKRLSCRFGIKGNAHTWIRSYLTNRSQFVCIDTERSASHKLNCGVPQGSVLGPLLYLLYTAPLGDIIKKHNISYHFYADDTQIYMTFQPSDENEPDYSKSLMERCIQDINDWMTTNRLKLNNDKTELILINASNRPLPSLHSIIADSELVQTSESIKNLGVWLDNGLSMKKQINVICKSAFYHLRNIASIRRFLSLHHCEILIHAFVTTKLDHCNSLLSGLPKYLIEKLQHVQNSAARLLTYTRKYDHITPVLKELHWLPIAERIDFKILLLTFKAINNIAPLYLKELLIPYQTTRTLRSSNKQLLVIPKYNMKSYGLRAFSVGAPILWNSLAEDIRCTTLLSTFKTKIKTFLFNRAFSKS